MGNNLAVKYVASDSKYLLFMNPDVILEPDYVAKLVDILENNNEIAMVQGLERRLNGDIKVGGVLSTQGFYVDLTLHEAARLKEVLIVFGAAMFIRRDVFERINGFPSEFFLYYDEADLGIRVRCHGYRATGAAETSYIHYVSGITSKVDMLSWYFQYRNRWLIILRYFHGRKFLEALLFNVYLALINLIIKGFYERHRVRLTLHMLRYIVKSLQREIIIKRSYRKCRKSYDHFIINKI